MAEVPTVNALTDNVRGRHLTHESHPATPRKRRFPARFGVEDEEEVTTPTPINRTETSELVAGSLPRELQGAYSILETNCERLTAQLPASHTGSPPIPQQNTDLPIPIDDWPWNQEVYSEVSSATREDTFSFLLSELCDSTRSDQWSPAMALPSIVEAAVKVSQLQAENILLCTDVSQTNPVQPYPSSALTLTTSPKQESNADARIQYLGQPSWAAPSRLQQEANAMAPAEKGGRGDEQDDKSWRENENAGRDVLFPIPENEEQRSVEDLVPSVASIASKATTPMNSESTSKKPLLPLNVITQLSRNFAELGGDFLKKGITLGLEAFVQTGTIIPVGDSPKNLDMLDPSSATLEFEEIPRQAGITGLATSSELLTSEKQQDMWTAIGQEPPTSLLLSDKNSAAGLGTRSASHVSQDKNFGASLSLSQRLSQAIRIIKAKKAKNTAEQEDVDALKTSVHNPVANQCRPLVCEVSVAGPGGVWTRDPLRPYESFSKGDKVPAQREQSLVLRPLSAGSEGSEEVLKRRLLWAAHALEWRNGALFQELVDVLRRFGRSRGPAMERFVHIMLKALLLRVEGSDAAARRVNTPPRRRIQELDNARAWYVTGTPVGPFLSMTMMGMIMPELMGKERAHVFVMGFAVIPQLHVAIKILAEPKNVGRPLKSMRVTLIDPWSMLMPGRSDIESIFQWGAVGAGLARTAQAVGVELHFRSIRLKEGNLELLDSIERDANETMVVTLVNETKFLSEDIGVGEGSRVKLFECLKRLEPDALAIVEEDYAASEAAFIPRFNACLDHFWAFFHAHDQCVRILSEKKFLFNVEENYHYSTIFQIVACEGDERRMRPCSKHDWTRSLESWGFKAVSPKGNLTQPLFQMLRCYPDGFGIFEDSSHWISLLWRGQSLFTASCWVPELFPGCSA